MPIRSAVRSSTKLSVMLSACPEKRKLTDRGSPASFKSFVKRSMTEDSAWLPGFPPMMMERILSVRLMVMGPVSSLISATSESRTMPALPSMGIDERSDRL